MPQPNTLTLLSPAEGNNLFAKKSRLLVLCKNRRVPLVYAHPYASTYIDKIIVFIYPHHSMVLNRSFELLVIMGKNPITNWNIRLM